VYSTSAQGACLSIINKRLSYQSPDVGVADQILDLGCGSTRPRQGLGSRAQAIQSKQPLLERAKAALAESPRYVLLDFLRVHGLDATAARTFGTLASTLAMMGVQLIVTKLDNVEAARLLAAHGVVLQGPGMGPLPVGAYRSFPTLNDGMVYCETQYLKVGSQFTSTFRRCSCMTRRCCILYAPVCS